MAYTGKKPVDFVDVTQSQSMTVSDDLTVDTNTLYVDSTNNRVGVGTTSPQGSGVHIKVPDGDTAIVLSGTTSTAGTEVKMSALNEATSGWHNLNIGSNETIFRTAGTERMRVNSSGALLLGTTVQNATLNVSYVSGSYTGYFAGTASGYNLALRAVTSSATAIRFLNSGGTDVGSIDTFSTSTSYTTSSDYRLKEDWQPMTGATERVKALNPVNFAWKSDGSRVDGFLAHEAQEIVPEAVTKQKDAMREEEYEVTPAVLDEDGNVVTEAVMGTRSVPDYQGIDQSKLVPLLTAALQEAIAKIETLEEKVAALENA
jgi:hypothetical protein